jgi:hypothetical protein
MDNIPESADVGRAFTRPIDGILPTKFDTVKFGGALTLRHQTDIPIAICGIVLDRRKIAETSWCAVCYPQFVLFIDVK